MSAEIRRQAPQEPIGERYVARVVCRNCGERQIAVIAKGTMVEEAVRPEKCVDCDVPGELRKAVTL